MTLLANQSGAIYGPTLGIARNLSVETVAPHSPSNDGRLSTPYDAPGAIQGGGNLNGTQATSILFSHAGTAAERIANPRKPSNPGNWCGIV